MIPQAAGIAVNVHQIARIAVTIYTDGSCPPKPHGDGSGGWGAILVSGNYRKEIGGWATETTNNKMEIFALKGALALLKKPSDITVVSDSQWMLGAVYGWDTANNVPDARHKYKISLPMRVYVEAVNSILMDGSHQLAAVQWVRGHDGHPENEKCDEIAEWCRLNKKEWSQHV